MKPGPDRQLRAPPMGGNVWPEERCPAFSVRTGLGCRRVCWFCRHADFHLRQRTPLDVGICCWPRVKLQ